MHIAERYFTMIRNENRKPGLFTIAVLAAISCYVTVVARQFRQAGLDHDLSVAAQQDDFVSVIQLLKGGANPDAPAYGPWLSDGIGRVCRLQSWSDNGPIRRTTGDTEIAKAFDTPRNLLPTDAELAIRARSKERKRVMFSAISSGDNATMVSMLKNGFPVDDRDSDGRTALIYAVNSRNRDAVVLLLKAGANPNVCTNDRICVISNAITYGDPRLVPLLLSAGATPNVQDIWGQTPLTLAAERGDIGNAQLFLQHGADPNLGNPDFGALDWAIKTNNQGMISLLKAHGAKAHAPATAGVK